jgi:hypothetical protein
VQPPTSYQRLYGPDRLRLEESAAATEARCGYRPFHGIASLGLRGHPACTPDAWPAIAPWLDTRQQDASTIGDAARACGVLSFDESLGAATHAALDYANGSRLTELWNLKEGHTASVWCASYEARGDHRPKRIALNVARDDVASRELEQATARFRELSEREPDIAAAHVLALWKLRRAGGGGEPVTVVAQTWVEAAYEIHAVPVGPGAGGQFCAVERFITDPAQPARFRSVQGWRLAVEEHRCAGRQMALLLRQGAQWQAGAWSLPHFEVHHGDWVWRHDRGLAIACSAAPTVVHTYSLSDAVYEVLRDTCRDLDAEYSQAVRDGAAAVL